MKHARGHLAIRVPGGELLRKDGPRQLDEMPHIIPNWMSLLLHARHSYCRRIPISRGSFAVKSLSSRRVTQDLHEN